VKEVKKLIQKQCKIWFKNSLAAVLVFATCIAPVAAQKASKNENAASVEAPRGPNLFSEIIERKDQLPWEFHQNDALPEDLCKILVTDCSSRKLRFKTFGFPLETPGEQGGGAIVLSWTSDPNHPDLVMLADATDDGASFFLVSTDGTLLKAAYRVKDGPWSPVSTVSAHDHFERQRKSWHDWFEKADHPQPRQRGRAESA
jgi:hypothetical protein